MVMRDVLADGMMMIGVREILLVGPVEGRGWPAKETAAMPPAKVAAPPAGTGATALRGWLPSVTDLSVMPWYVPVVSILKPSVSKKIIIN